MITPPIVGVPAFWWCPSGPSSRMCWPNSRSRRNSMNFGLRNRQMSSAAVPPNRIRPISAARRAGAGAVGAPCSCARAPAERCTRSSPTPREAFTSTVSPSCSSVASSSAAAPRIGHGVGLARELRAHLGRQRPDGDEQVDAAFARVQPDLAVQALRLRAQLEHVAEHRHAARGRRLEPGRRSPRAWTSGWRCSSRRSRPPRRAARGARRAAPRSARPGCPAGRSPAPAPPRRPPAG